MHEMSDTPGKSCGKMTLGWGYRGIWDRGIWEGFKRTLGGIAEGGIAEGGIAEEGSPKRTRGGIAGTLGGIAGGIAAGGIAAEGSRRDRRRRDRRGGIAEGSPPEGSPPRDRRRGRDRARGIAGEDPLADQGDREGPRRGSRIERRPSEGIGVKKDPRIGQKREF
jgi:hypothetical protein